MLKLQRVEQVLFFLTLLLLPTQLGKHFWPEFSYVFSLPIDYLSPTLYFWDVLMIILLTSFALQKKQVNKLAVNLFLIFILTQAVSLIFSSNLETGLVRLEQYFIAGLFGVYIASYKFSVLSSRLFWPLTLGVLGESTLAITQFVRGGTLGLWILGERTFSISTPAIAKFDFYGRQFLRPYATFPHPNVLAAFMVITTLLLSFWRPKADRISEMLSLRSSMTILSVLLGGLAILLTVSRTAILAFAIAWIILRRKFLPWIIFGIILLSPFLYVRYLAIFNFDNVSFLRREALTLQSIELFSKNLLFGVGLNNFIPVSSSNLSAGPSRFLQPVHNIFLLTLSETGIIGAIGIIGLIGYPIFKLFRLQTTNEPRTLLLVWGVILFLGMFDHYFLTLPQGYRLLFLVWGLSLSFKST